MSEDTLKTMRQKIEAKLSNAHKGDLDARRNASMLQNVRRMSDTDLSALANAVNAEVSRRILEQADDLARAECMRLFNEAKAQVNGHMRQVSRTAFDCHVATTLER